MERGEKTQVGRRVRAESSVSDREFCTERRSQRRTCPARRGMADRAVVAKVYGLAAVKLSMGLQLLFQFQLQLGVEPLEQQAGFRRGRVLLSPLMLMDQYYVRRASPLPLPLVHLQHPNDCLQIRHRDILRP